MSLRSAAWPSSVGLEDDSDNDTHETKHTSEDHNDEHADEARWSLSVEEHGA